MSFTGLHHLREGFLSWFHRLQNHLRSHMGGSCRDRAHTPTSPNLISPILHITVPWMIVFGKRELWPGVKTEDLCNDNIGRKSALKSNPKTKGYSKDWFAPMLSVPPGQGFLFPLGILASTFFLVTLCKIFSFHNKHIGLTN